MAPTHPGKVLRFAVIQGGKVIEDRTLDRRESVTIGNAAKNTVVVPMSDLPPSFTVFDFKGQQYSLCFTERMEGRLSVPTGNDKVSFAALRSQGVAKKHGEVYVVQLDDQSKGSVSLGEVTLLFQFVNPPKAAPKMELPAAARGSLFNTIDRTFTAILLGFLITEFTGVFILSQRPVDEQEVTLDELPDRFVKMIIPEKPKEKPKPVEQQSGEKKDEAKKEAKKETGEPKKASPGPKDDAEHKAAVARAVASKGLLKILGANGVGGGGMAIEDVLGSGGASGDIANALAGAGGVSAATGDELAGGGKVKGGGSGNAAGIGDLATGGGGKVDTGTKQAVRVSGRVMDSGPEVESGDVDRDKLVAYVKLRLRSIQTCYERELKRNASLKGKIVVRFTIGTTGRITDIEIDENTMGSDEVANCIKSVMRVWLFPFKPDAEVPVSYPFLFAPTS